MLFNIGLNPSLIQKGLRQRRPVGLIAYLMFESFPDSEGIKTTLQHPYSIHIFGLNPSLIQKGLRPHKNPRSGPAGRLNPSLIQKGLRPSSTVASGQKYPFESFPDSEGIKTTDSPSI